MSSDYQKCQSCGGSGRVKYFVPSTGATIVESSSGPCVMPGKPATTKWVTCFRCSGRGGYHAGGSGQVGIIPQPVETRAPAASEVHVIHEGRWRKFTQESWNALSAEKQAEVLQNSENRKKIEMLYSGGEK